MLKVQGVVFGGLGLLGLRVHDGSCYYHGYHYACHQDDDE